MSVGSTNKLLHNSTCVVIHNCFTCSINMLFYLWWQHW